MLGGRLRTWCGVLCAIPVLVAVVPASAGASGFCETGAVRNYEKPLEALPPLRPGPVDERLPFGPRNLFFGPIGDGPVAVGSQQVGYSLTYSRSTPRPTGKKLGWLVTAKLDRIDAKGRALERLAFKQVDGLRLPSKHTLAFRISAEPALYRIEVVFRDGSGKRLGRYGKYLLIIEQQSGARLNLLQSSYRPGETVVPRLENEGTDTLFYGLGYVIEEFDGVEWVPTSLGPKFFLLIGLSSSPGEAASCWRFTVPAETPPGKYRFRLSIDVYKEPSRRESPEHSSLTAEFEVVP